MKVLSHLKVIINITDFILLRNTIGCWNAGKYQKIRGEQSKVFPASFNKERLVKMILVQGENKLNEFREKFREFSVLINMQVTTFLEMILMI